jgi:hypothetical protein
MNYPKRTPGSPQHRSNYAVYDRLAESSKGRKESLVPRLLPPNEVPEFPEKPHQPNNQDHALAIQEASVVPMVQTTTRLVVQENSGDKIGSADSVRKAQKTEAVKRPSKNSSDGGPGHVKKQGDRKANDASGHKKVGGGGHNGGKPGMGGGKKKVLGIQIGDVYEKEHQAKALLVRLVKQGGVRCGIRPILQKANVKGVFRYRVILSGRCSKEEWAAYRAWLMRQDI